jgi:ABC-2 type transport system permease protein
MFGAEARAQYGALARLRWHMFGNGLRSKKGALELGARAFSFLFYVVGGLGCAVGAGAFSYLMVSGEKWSYLPILFWTVFFVWQGIPIMLASFQEQFDLGILLRFPIRFGSYFLLYVVFGLLDISTILGGLCCLGLLVGTTAARPDLFGWTALGLVVFAAFNILLVRAIFAWIDRWLAQRKTREILGAVFMVLILSVQLLNPALHRHRQPSRDAAQKGDQAEQYRRAKAEFQARYGPWLGAANAVQEWLPPGLAAMAMRHAAEHDTGSDAGAGQPWGSLESLSVLGLYVLGAGGVLGARLRAEYRGESLGVAPKRAKVVPGQGVARQGKARAGGGALGGSGPIAAVIEKELRTLMRTLPLLYAIGAPLLLVLVFSGALIRNGPAQHTFALALPLCMVYAQLGFTRLFYNNLGAEGAGIQLYFLSPTPFRTVMLAKNLFHSAMFAVTIVIAGTLAMLRLGVPGADVLAATGAWLVFSLPANLAAGNVFSLTLPYRVNPGRITRQGGSQASALGALLVQAVVMGLGAAVFGLGWYLGKIWVAVPLFLVMAVGAVVGWLRVLRNADSMANQRRDGLIGTLMKEQ